MLLNVWKLIIRESNTILVDYIYVYIYIELVLVRVTPNPKTHMRSGKKIFAFKECRLEAVRKKDHQKILWGLVDCDQHHIVHLFDPLHSPFIPCGYFYKLSTGGGSRHDFIYSIMHCMALSSYLLLLQ